MSDMAYVPGAARFTCAARERRYETYRTWRGKGDMGWCAECLLCGEWTSSQPSRIHAGVWAADRHPGWCHVVNGCHCYQPHITAAMGRRLGLGAEYPRHTGRALFQLAGGVRRYQPPTVDLWGQVHHGLMTYLSERIRAGIRGRSRTRRVCGAHPGA